MKNLTITKGAKTEVPTEYQLDEGCIAFQKVQIEFNYLGVDYSEIHDTKILPCGKQLVISGDGFVKDGFELN